MAKHVIYVNWDAFDSRYLGMTPTPVLDRLAAEGALWREAQAGIPTITPCMQTSIVTGAWPVIHGNTYRYYDRRVSKVRQVGRENSAETIAEVAERVGLSTASVQQFTLRNRGTYPDREGHLYREPGGGLRRRLDEALKLLQPPDEAEPPRFLALYADDLDAIGHNHGPLPEYQHEKGGTTEEERRALCLERLGHMDQLLGELVAALPPDSALLLTSDHGMVGYQGRSKLPRVLAALQGQGLSVEVLATDMEPSVTADLALVTVGMQVQLSWVRPATSAKQEALAHALNLLSTEDWLGGWMDRSALDQRGAYPDFADLLLWPKEGYHCHVQDEVEFPPVASHDTPLAGRVPLLLWGSGVRHLVSPTSHVETIDAAPTMAHLLGIPAPAQATGRVLFEALR